MDRQELPGALVDEIRTDREGGASEIARRCLEILAANAVADSATSAVDLRRKLERLARSLQAARPSMAPVHNLVGAWLKALAGTPARTPEQLAEGARAATATITGQSRRAVAEAAAAAAGAIGPGRTIMTHSLSSTVRETFRRLEPRETRAIVTESRPLEEGRRMAEELSRLGIATTYITDAQMGLFVRAADFVLVGADTVLEDGSVVNKAGTALLALAANDAGVPVYAVFESFKESEGGPASVRLEEMAQAEIRGPDLPHVTVRNVYFDITPGRLVTAWISEHGLRVKFDSGRGPKA